MMQRLLLMALLLAGAGCRHHVDVHLTDNPQVRERQRVELGASMPEDFDQRKLKAYVVGRTAYLATDIPDDDFDFGNLALAGSGRAAALTPDGYFLTAHHVIADHSFALLESTVSPDFKPRPGPVSAEDVKRYFRRRASRGRVVWEDPAIDLAIVKFDVRGQACFKDEASHLPVGAFLYAADDFGVSSNGIFEAGGRVLVSGGRQAPGGARITSTSIVARRGMSGAPVVDENGDLCGVLTKVHFRMLPRFRSRTSVVMLPLERIHQIIEEDRRRQAPSRGRRSAVRD